MDEALGKANHEREASDSPNDALAPTRRGFLRGAATKAVYVTPLVLTLTAPAAAAVSVGGFDSTCGDKFSPCTTQADCCPGLNCNGDPSFCMGGMR